MKVILSVALGGSLGALSRYYSTLFFNTVKPGFPLGTLFVNLSGSFFLGFLISWSARAHIPAEARLFLMTGFLGAFTTFSTYAAESMYLLKSGQIKPFIMNIALNTFLGLTAAAAGMYAGEAVL
ncbi:MAG: fluoride efflux transporter CrcB [Fibrobacterota bacterium]